jgi:hypothetical protein
MKTPTPSFITTSIVILFLIVVPLLTATLVVVFITDRFLVGFLLFFTLGLLLIIIPYFALLIGLIPPKTWLNTYLQVLSRIPIIQLIVRRRHHLLQVKDLPDLLSSIIQRRLQTEDWKHLHADCQAISLKLVIIRGVASPDNLHMVLHDLETHWRMECSNMITKFIALEHMPDSYAKRELVKANNTARWFEKLELIIQQTDQIIDLCVTVEDLKVHQRDLMASLFSMELVVGQLLNFLDSRIQKTIRELDGDIEKIRANLMSVALN